MVFLVVVTAVGGSLRFTYRWDGSQTGFDLDADHLFGEMADELLYHGDVNSALRQMMQNGLTDRDGRDMEGIRDMMQRLRERRARSSRTTISAASTTTSPIRARGRRDGTGGARSAGSAERGRGRWCR